MCMAADAFIKEEDIVYCCREQSTRSQMSDQREETALSASGVIDHHRCKSRIYIYEFTLCNVCKVCLLTIRRTILTRWWMVSVWPRCRTHTNAPPPPCPPCALPPISIAVNAHFALWQRTAYSKRYVRIKICKLIYSIPFFLNFTARVALFTGAGGARGFYRTETVRSSVVLPL